MGENSKIEWTHHTFNPWIGCTKVSPGCDHCYAEGVAARFKMAEWGVGKPRRLAHDDYWKQPLAWNKKAACAGIRQRVFCASLADVFDNEVPPEWRVKLWDLIDATPHLDWLLLTKRIGNAKIMMGARQANSSLKNVWLGISVVNQEEANRDIPKLLATPARIRFLSIEPLLGPVDLRQWFPHHHPDNNPSHPAVRAVVKAAVEHFGGAVIDWVIVGGESGHNARAKMTGAMVRSLRDQCAAAGVPFFFKQWGEFKDTLELDDPDRHAPLYYTSSLERVGKKSAGRLLDGREWNQFPKVYSEA